MASLNLSRYHTLLDQGTFDSLDQKQSVRASTTGPGTLASGFEAGDTIDGIVLAAGNRILIKDQTNGIENGIYTVNASGAPTRTSDFDTGSTVAGAFTFVEEGTTNSNTGWIVTSNQGSDVVGTNIILLSKFATGGSGVTGPGSSTDNAIARFDGITGTIIQNSGILLTDTNDFSGINDIIFESGTFDTTLTVTTQTIGAPTITVPNLEGTSGNLIIDNATQTLTNKTLTSPVLTTPEINDTSADHQYIFAVNELTADRNITLPLLGSDDTFVFESFTQTLTNKTISDSTNTVGANELRTTGASVVIDTAPSASAGQVLTATSATSATWQTPGAGSSGTISYHIAPTQFSASSTTNTTIGYFPWLNGRYTGYTSGVVILNTTIVDRNLIIRLQDITNAVTLGSATVTSSGVTEFSVSNPGSDADVQLQISKSATGGTNPILLGAVLEFIQ